MLKQSFHTGVIIQQIGRYLEDSGNKSSLRHCHANSKLVGVVVIYTMPGHLERPGKQAARLLAVDPDIKPRHFQIEKWKTNIIGAS
jgi:hypothetical protein